MLKETKPRKLKREELPDISDGFFYKNIFYEIYNQNDMKEMVRMNNIKKGHIKRFRKEK